ncbi:hypothetical protein PMAYCL1PPCAC_20314 [Pristionchus mayeri]|uniref:Plethodontid modulating factor n=1 Tax=Pristionchus mayeri TaxID=1317129 RepID=A0AAN5CT43_9BILA|nr:hypothetical protein PMAYCL1PPCAC_20314 [Pristionchus mayeri]
MLSKAFLTLLLAAGVFSLECVFEVQAGATILVIERGVYKCESGDELCASLNYNGIYAKGCSKTADKITGVGMPAHISCNAEKC